METEKVTTKSLPPFRPDLEDVGFDKQQASENARWALNGAEAISTIIMDNIDGEGKGRWSEGFISHLHQGQQALLAFARRQVETLNHEAWYMHALLGDYGESVKLRAQREMLAVKEERAA